MTTPPIFDLHCDLLMALAAGKSPYDEVIRCSLPQMRMGGVQWQLLPIFVETAAHSVSDGERQAEHFHSLSSDYPDDFSQGLSSKSNATGKIEVAYAIENASAFCGEEEPLDEGLGRLNGWISQMGKPAYVSFTWKYENRFGGGNETCKGLKPDGKELLKYLAAQGITIDLSHTSDALAEDILTYDVSVMASHSNFRSICDHGRNLRDDIAKEIVGRKGVIGLNAVRHFVGDRVRDLTQHVEHALVLGAEKSLCFGADFFWEEGIAGEGFFFEEFGNSSHYPKVIKQLSDADAITPTLIEDICRRNAQRWLSTKELYEK